MAVHSWTLTGPAELWAGVGNFRRGAKRHGRLSGKPATLKERGPVAPVVPLPDASACLRRLLAGSGIVVGVTPSAPMTMTGLGAGVPLPAPLHHPPIAGRV